MRLWLGIFQIRRRDRRHQVASEIVHLTLKHRYLNIRPMSSNNHELVRTTAQTRHIFFFIFKDPSFFCEKIVTDSLRFIFSSIIYFLTALFSTPFCHVLLLDLFFCCPLFSFFSNIFSFQWLDFFPSLTIFSVEHFFFNDYLHWFCSLISLTPKVVSFPSTQLSFISSLTFSFSRSFIRLFLLFLFIFLPPFSDGWHCLPVSGGARQNASAQNLARMVQTANRDAGGRRHWKSELAIRFADQKKTSKWIGEG